MTKILLTIISFSFLNIDAKAQVSTQNLDSAIAKNRKANGIVLIHTNENDLKLYVEYKNKKVKNIYAISKSGIKINPTYEIPETIAAAKEKNDFETTPLKCKVCFETSDGKTVDCYYIDCSQRPPGPNPPKKHG